MSRARKLQKTVSGAVEAAGAPEMRFQRQSGVQGAVGAPEMRFQRQSGVLRAARTPGN